MTTAIDLQIRRLTPADVSSIARVYRAAFPDSGVTALGATISERYHALAVDPSQQRLGIGGRLMLEAEAFVGQLDYDHMLRAVVTSNQRAIRL